MLKKSKKIKLLIVDFDNTLFDTKKVNYLAYKKTFEKLKIKFTKKKYEKYYGLNKIDFYKKVVGLKYKKKFEQIYNLKKKYYQNYLEKIKINIQLFSLLKILKKNRVKICLVSNASCETVNLVLKKFKINKFFNRVVTSNQMIECKSNGKAFKNLMKLYKANKFNTIVVDDNEIGVKASKVNNLQVLIVKNFN